LSTGMAPGDALLLGTDLVKDPGRLVRAYDDSAGVTAEFNRNVLRVLARELDAQVDPEAFEHVAVWNAEQEWIEMRLRSVRAQVVRVLD
ncbi:L-histidine N(alpha)-methyltransferase, partial [Enterococcus faecalis]|uniref:L-histidine N(alpha)-methyltransferase n=2 Tax=Bacillati TaxID=1783272 RepID=UPI003D6B169F